MKARGHEARRTRGESAWAASAVGPASSTPPIWLAIVAPLRGQSSRLRWQHLRGAISIVLAGGWERRGRLAGKKDSPEVEERGRHACPTAGTRGGILAPPPSDSVYDGVGQCVEGCLFAGDAPISRCDRRSSGGGARDTHEVASDRTIVERIGLFRLDLTHTIAVDREIEANVSPFIAYLSSTWGHDPSGSATLAVLPPTVCDLRW